MNDRSQNSGTFPLNVHQLQFCTKVENVVNRQSFKKSTESNIIATYTYILFQNNLIFDDKNRDKEKHLHKNLSCHQLVL